MFISSAKNFFIRRQVWSLYCKQRLCQNTTRFTFYAQTRKSKVDATNFRDKDSIPKEEDGSQVGDKQLPLVGVGMALFRVPPIPTIRYSEWEILLIERGSEPGKGQWSFPGGKVEFGETLSEAFLREVKEETGLKPVVGPIFGVFDSFFSNKEGKLEFHFVIVDAIGFVSSDAKPIPGDDVKDARWFKVDRALKLENCTKGLSEAIERAVSLLERGHVQIPSSVQK